MTTFRNSAGPGQLTPDTQPGALPSQPDVGLWSDSDVGLPRGPAATFKTSPPSSSDEQMPTIGHIGRYALKYRIGAGGLGTVYAAYDPLLSRLIAIKTLNLDLAPDERESFNRLFLDEARAAGGLSHPHIVTVFDAGISDNNAYIAMEMLKGRDLRQLRQEGWRPTPTQAALIVRRVADALAYAHSKGVVHRDIKPANIFMVGRTQPRVLDFGIARVAHRHDLGADAELAAGSPYYMAPEQARHQTVDRRADVFSLGVVLYELLTDSKPFNGDTLPDITRAVLTYEPPLASTVDPRVPQGLAEICARALLKDPEQRYRSARAFSRDLRHWLEEQTPSAESEPPPSAPPPARRKWIQAGLAALVIGGVGLMAMLAARQFMTRAPAEAEQAAAPAAPPAAGTIAGTTAGAASAPGSAAAPNAATAAAAAAVPTTTTQAAAAADPASAAAAGSATAAATTAAPPPGGTPGPAQAGAKGLAAAPSAAAKPPAPPKTAATKPAPARPAAKPAAARNGDGQHTAQGEAQALMATPAPVKLNGTLRIAISPWGQVEVNGAPAGTAPPLTELSLPEGRHQVVIRNGDFAPYRVTVTVTPGQPVSIKHKFGP